MARMRQQVADNNIYRWAGMLLSEAGKLVQGGQRDEARPDGRNGAIPSLQVAV